MYPSKASAELEKDFIIRDSEVFVSMFKYSGNGIAAVSGSNITLEPDVSPGWTLNAFQSAVGLNVVVKGNSGKVFVGKVSANTTDDFTFVATGLKNIADGTAGAASDWTNGTGYDFYLLEPHASCEHGNFFGYCKEMDFTPEEETAEFEYNVPSELIREDTLGMKFTLKGKNFNASNPDIFEAVWNMVKLGNPSGYTERFGGFRPPPRPFFRLTLVGEDVEGKELILQIFKTKFRIDGGLNFSAREYKGLGFMAKAFKDVLRPWGGANAYKIKRAA